MILPSFVYSSILLFRKLNHSCSFCRKKVIALLCCDTLKSDRTGTGRPFKPIELDFFQACASTMSKILDQNNKEILKHHNTPSVIKKFKDQLKEIKLARVEQMKKEKVDALKRKKVKEKANKLKQFNELHKVWEEHQAVKARIKEKLKRQRERMKKMLKEDGEELQVCNCYKINQYFCDIIIFI